MIFHAWELCIDSFFISQLYYAQRTLDTERPSWRPVVYFNVIKGIRMILDELEYEFGRGSDSGTSSPPSAVDMSEQAEEEINDLRTQLIPLLAMEASLAAELGGLPSRGGFYVRSGWQSMLRQGLNLGVQQQRSPAMVNLAGRTLGQTRQPVLDLWNHPTVKGLFKARRIRLEESAPLCVLTL